jgi:histidine ammonia-lyase
VVEALANFIACACEQESLLGQETETTPVSDRQVVRLTSRHDINLDAVDAVARKRATVDIAPEARALMDRCARSFDQLVDERVRADPEALIYGVTSAPGDRAAIALDVAAQARRPTRLWTAVSYGESLPDRVVRAIVLARLANFLGGHAAARGSLAVAVAEMLDHESLPSVPVQSNGGSGEVLALGTLFYELSDRLSLRAKERMALINGSPCAAALVADVALAGRQRIAVAELVFALIADVAKAPDEHFAPELDELWGDEHEAAALRSLRALLAGSRGDRQRHQAAVSLRILPRVLGATRRAQADAERAATVSLASVTDNPVYIPPTHDRPLGTVYSTGGYHNALATPAIDALAVAHANLCQLAQRLTDHLFQHPAVGPLISRDEWTLKPLHMAQNGWAEEARANAHPTLLSLGGFGQNDVPSLSFLAWQKATAIGRCLDAASAALAAIGSQALHMSQRPTTAPLQRFLSEVRDVFEPIDHPRPIGTDCQRLTDEFTRRATY